MSLLDLAEQMDELAARIIPAANELSKEVANAILEDLTLITPVDVGTALSNWQVTLNSPAISELDAFSPSPKGRTVNGVWQHSVLPEVTRGLNAGTVLDLGSAVIEGKQPGDAVFITNNVPYIQKLNDGSSEQAPNGFVQRAETLAQVIIDKGLNLS